ncbi:phage integrase SAM-like domain-containing protein [Alistipes sp. OttesenSCG-928-B03]|nr:phage integrase SAM-like domain-containing protein [Alistipes sp. OttesenSCG-928-B03]
MKTTKMTYHKASVRFMFDTRVQLKNGKYPVRIEVYHKGEAVRYTTGVRLTPDEWRDINLLNSTSQTLKHQKKKLLEFQTSANTIIDQLDSGFTFPIFGYLFTGKISKGFINMCNVYDVFQQYSDKLKEEGRMSTYDTYIYTMNSMKQFKPELTFDEVTVDFLKGYENYMIKNEKSLSTIGIYLRNMRAIMNIARRSKIISDENYPFGAAKDKYSIPQGCKIKKALEDEDLSKIINHKSKSSIEVWALDMWLFSFYCNGMNTADIFNLKYIF